MKITVTESMFRDAFQRLRPNNFSYEGLSVLFAYLGEMDREAQEEMELDVIAICCEWSELTFEEFHQEYDVEVEDEGDVGELKEAITNYLESQATIAGFTEDSVVFASF